MSRQAVAEFLERVRVDASLQQRLVARPTSTAYVEEGKREGFAFSLQELQSVTNAERFYVGIQGDAGLAKRLSRAPSEAAVLALATECGFECEVEDLQAVLRAHMSPELSDAELGSVAGGGSGWSFPSVRKTPSPIGPIPIPYPKF